MLVPRFKYNLKNILVTVMLLVSVVACAQVDRHKQANAKIKSIFVYNFTKYIEWPESYRKGDFIIGVLGNSPIISELHKMAKVKRVGSQNFRIVQFNSVDEIEKCHMLFLTTEESGKLDQVKEKINNYNTLLITENDGLAHNGAAINFVAVNNKQEFELNKRNLVKYNLKVSSGLLTLAILVDEQ